MIWKHASPLEGYINAIIRHFLLNQKIRVKEENTYSKGRHLDEGVSHVNVPF